MRTGSGFLHVAELAAGEVRPVERQIRFAHRPYGRRAIISSEPPAGSDTPARIAVHSTSTTPFSSAFSQRGSRSSDAGSKVSRRTPRDSTRRGSVAMKHDVRRTI